MLCICFDNSLSRVHILTETRRVEMAIVFDLILFMKQKKNHRRRLLGGNRLFACFFECRQNCSNLSYKLHTYDPISSKRILLLYSYGLYIQSSSLQPAVLLLCMGKKWRRGDINPLVARPNKRHSTRATIFHSSSSKQLFPSLYFRGSVFRRVITGLLLLHYVLFRLEMSSGSVVRHVVQCTRRAAAPNARSAALFP